MSTSAPSVVTTLEAMSRPTTKKTNGKLLSPRSNSNGNKSNGNSPVVVSPDEKQHQQEGSLEKGKIQHAAQLLPEALEHKAAGKIKHAAQLSTDANGESNERKRDVPETTSEEDGVAAVVTPASKRRRMAEDVTIQRGKEKGTATTTATKKKVIPEPPSSDPPQPTKFMKVLVLGPAAHGKTEWVQGLKTPPKMEEDDATLGVNYASKDYSFESSMGTQETVRMSIFDCDITGVEQEPPFSWKHTLVPSMQHIVLVLDLFAVPDAQNALSQWKAWLERHLVGTKKGKEIPVSLLLINSNLQDDAVKVTSKDWFRLGATVEKVCRDWHVNKWYMMENEATSSDVVLQTLIERTWSAMGFFPEMPLPQDHANGTSASTAIEIADD